MEQFEYLNKDTGVSCWFEVFDPSSRDPLAIPEGFTEVGLGVFTSLFRPSFFALEVMPMVETMCRALDLLIIDPPCAPEEVHATQLIERWDAKNATLTRYLARREPAIIVKPYLPQAHSVDSWKFNCARKRYQDALGPNVTVPLIDFAVNNQQRVQRVVTWARTGSSPAGQAFPPCDYIKLGSDSNTATDGRVPRHVAAPTVMHYLDNLLSTVECPIGHLAILSPDRVDEAAQAFERIQSEALRHTLTYVHAKDFVDCLDYGPRNSTYVTTRDC
jgi:hypothetical protein